MSGLHDTIATLTGNLQFIVDNSGLTKFQNSLNQVQRQMAALSKQADKLAEKMSIAPKVGKQKLDASVEQGKARALKLETELAKAQRATFQAELQQSKLRYAGHKEDALLTTQSLKQKQLNAVWEAKAAQAEQQRLKTQGIELKNQQSVEAAKARQVRWAEALRTQQQRTLLLENKRLQQMTRMEKLEYSLQQARERGQRQAEQYQRRAANYKIREQRSEERHAQQQQRFKWAETRQAAWQARQDTPAIAESTGMSELAGALGGVGVAVYALGKAASYLNDRVEHRQEATADTQQFDFSLMSASEDPKVRSTLNKRYKETFNDYGMEVDTESARQYNNSSAAMMKHGYSAEKAADILDDRYAAFRIGNISDANQKRIALHLDHILAAGHATGQNTRPLMSELGGKVAQDVYVGSAHALGYKGKDDGAQGFFYQMQKAGKITADAFYAGIHLAVQNNPEVLARHKGSIEAQEARLKNDKFLQTDEQQKNPELLTAISDRISAERQLVKAMGPVQDAFVSLDIQLTKFETNLLHRLAGKNDDGTKKTDAQTATGVASVGTIEGPAIDPAALTGAKTSNSSGPVNDPVDRFWKWVFNNNDNNKVDGPASNLKVTAPNGFSPIPVLDTSKFDTSNLPKHLEDLMQSPAMQGLARMAVQTVDMNPQSRGYMTGTDPYVQQMMKAQLQPPITNNNTTTNNTTNAPVTNVTVQVTTNADPDQIAHAVDDRLQHHMHEMMIDTKEVK